MPLQSRQYEERINKLEAALEMAKLRYQSQSGRMKILEDENNKLKDVMAEQKAELDAILSNRQVNTLLEHLKEERTQRLVEMEAAHVRERELQALSNEAAVATKGALLAHEDASHKRAEVNGLRASMRVTAKLLTITEKDFLATHKELEETKLHLLDARRKLVQKTDEANVWTDRYNQAMVDLHMAQMKLAHVSIGASAKESALMRGYGVVLAEAAGEPARIQRQPFLSCGTAKHNGATADRAMARHNLQLARSESLESPLNHVKLHRRHPVERIELAPFDAKNNRHSAPAKMQADDKYVDIAEVFKKQLEVQVEEEGVAAK
ncbi:Aste57867_11533 [Aphanomyces stellatus]|uniref:Aste57867_11533 protein n=1 Tax=Aphanomyces stellatus TaxID=120398 RepID=A0A485KTB1_9STRA|nr:hypothetical protein As57867_011490 [Aphanomyces stellatus]VFT88394.1 Aste57867_11533 [Aphanomyces stellatus]